MALWGEHIWRKSNQNSHTTKKTEKNTLLLLSKRAGLLIERRGRIRWSSPFTRWRNRFLCFLHDYFVRARISHGREEDNVRDEKKQENGEWNEKSNTQNVPFHVPLHRRRNATVPHGDKIERTCFLLFLPKSFEYSFLHDTDTATRDETNPTPDFGSPFPAARLLLRVFSVHFCNFLHFFFLVCSESLSFLVWS